MGWVKDAGLQGSEEGDACIIEWVPERNLKRFNQ